MKIRNLAILFLLAQFSYATPPGGNHHHNHRFHKKKTQANNSNPGGTDGGNSTNDPNPPNPPRNPDPTPEGSNQTGSTNPYVNQDPIVQQFMPGTYMSVVCNFITGECLALPTTGSDRPPVYNANGSPYTGPTVEGNGGHAVLRDVLKLDKVGVDSTDFPYGGGGFVYNDDGTITPKYKSASVNQGYLPEIFWPTFHDILEAYTGCKVRLDEK